MHVVDFGTMWLTTAIDSLCTVVGSSGAQVSYRGRNLRFHKCQCGKHLSASQNWVVDYHCRRRVIIRHATKIFGLWRVLTMHNAYEYDSLMVMSRCWNSANQSALTWAITKEMGLVHCSSLPFYLNSRLPILRPGRLFWTISYHGRRVRRSTNQSFDGHLLAAISPFQCIHSIIDICIITFQSYIDSLLASPRDGASKKVKSFSVGFQTVAFDDHKPLPCL